MSIRVAIFDDHRQVLEGLKQLINFTAGFEVVGTYPDCRNLVRNLTNNPADVVLMDIQMDDINGIDAVKTIREHFPDIKVVMQTVFEDDDKIFGAICAGACGYILKSSPPLKYIESIQDAYTGGSPMSSTIASRVLAMFRHQAAPVDSSTKGLSEREREILQHLVNGMSYKMIADTCHISYDTVRFHIKNIYAKLHVHSMTEAVSKALRNKLV